MIIGIMLIIIVGIFSLFLALMMYGLAKSSPDNADKRIIMKKVRIAAFLAVLTFGSLGLLFLFIMTLPTS